MNIHDMMDEQNEISWLKEKKGLVHVVLKEMLEESVRDYIRNGNYSSMEELDKWIDEAYASYVETRSNVKNYYDSKIYG